MNVVFKSPATKKELGDYYFLRWKLLRKPFNQKIGSEKDEYENKAFHGILKKDNSSIVGVGRIHFVDNDFNKAQVRYMAIDNAFRGKGHGTFLLKGLEKIAIKKKVKQIFLHSRNESIDFYLKNGYKKMYKTHLLFGKIQHFLMIKDIK